MATGSDRKIDIFIVGAQKSAATALYRFLGQHPEIYLPRIKKNQYFVRDEFHRRGERYLLPFYRGPGKERLIGCAYANLMYFSRAVERMYSHNPRMKLIAVLRDPVERAYSAYRFARRKGWESRGTFEEALEAEPRRAPN